MKLLKANILFTALLIVFSHTVNAEEKLASKSLWSQPVVIGASVSDGYDQSEPIGGVKSERLSLENYLNKLIVAPHGEIKNLGNKFFFMRPSSVSTKQVESAVALKPSVILAPDFLFWLVYGNMPDAKARINSLNYGLKLLESFQCPLVLGNIPDASKAIYKMLSPSQVPTAETLVAVNNRIREWGSKRANVVIMDNAYFMKKSHQNEEIKLKQNVYAKGETKNLLQTDFLHPTAKGARAVACALLERLQVQTRFPESDVRWKAE